MLKRILKIKVVFLMVIMLCKSAYSVSFDVEETFNSIFVIESYGSSGSGFAVNENTILTNAHVVENRYGIVVKGYDGRKYNATLKYINNEFDIAVLVLGGVRLVPLELPDNLNVKAGDDVYAVGSPHGLDYTLTKGIVSNANRTIDDHKYIQTDASLNPGNSGGPLINDAGYVIGINTMKIRDSEGLNLAIPIDVAIRHLKNNGIVLSNVTVSESDTITSDDDSNYYVKPNNASNESEKKNETQNYEFNLFRGFTINHIVVLIAFFILLLITILFYAMNHKINKNIYHKYDPRERVNFDIDIME